MGLALVAVFLYAGSMSTSRDRRRPGRRLVRPDPAALLRHLRDLDGRRDQPRAVRPARGRGRAGRRLPHRVLLAQVRAVLPRRVHQHGHRLRPGHHAVPRRLAGAVGRSTASGPAPTTATGRCCGSSARCCCFIFVFIWLRGTLPRLRYDQFMAFGWKVLIPVSLVWIVAVATVRGRRVDGDLDRPIVLVGVGASCSLVVLVLLRRLRLRGRRGRDGASVTDAGGYPGAAAAGGAVPAQGAAAPVAMPAHVDYTAGPATTVPRRRGGSLMADDTGDPCSRSSSWDPVAGLRGHLPDHVQEGGHRAVPVEKKPTAPRFHGRHQLNRWPDGLEKCIGCELCAWACPADAIYVEGAATPTDGAVLPRGALRPRLPDQLPALHPVRPVHRGLPDPGADDDQRVRAGRRQPGGPDLREVRPARAAAARAWSSRRTPMRARATTSRTTTAATCAAPAARARPRQRTASHGRATTAEEAHAVIAFWILAPVMVRGGARASLVRAQGRARRPAAGAS